MSTTIERMARAYFEATFDGHTVSDAYLEEEWQRCRERFCQQMAKAEASLWQPIETAPKDGTSVLVTNGHCQAVVWWSDRFAIWTLYQCACCDDGEQCGELVGVTHWRPLPEPPA